MADDATETLENNNAETTSCANVEMSSNNPVNEGEENGVSVMTEVNVANQEISGKQPELLNGHEFKAPNSPIPVAPSRAKGDRKNSLLVTQSKQSSSQQASSDCEKNELTRNSHASIPYTEPEWGGEASEKYSFDVLKNGTIIGNIPLDGQSYFVFGRLQSCDVTLEHPSLSRYHAVIQYSKELSHFYEKGWYIYDLDSTHGTWVNKRKLKPKQYYRLKVGHVIKFGGSSRLHILQGPDHDAEEESELGITELKQQREIQRKEAELLHQNELQKTKWQQEAEQKLLADQGCSWGMAEDAIDTEEENLFASLVPENESTYIDDPKKALKGFYEREGCDLPDYQFVEMSIGKHKCRLDLPVDGPNGEELVAEAVVSGKKKDAVIACALEACRMLDRMGMLRPSQHESRKRKQKNWEADDFYDSDEDTFLDRTGTIEKKRFMRMKKAGKDEAETYESLMEKYTKVTSQIAEIEAKLEKAKAEAEALAKEEMDELDAYMVSIKSGAMDTKTRMRLKGELLHLKMEEKHLSKLVNIARPASLPPLKTEKTKDLDIPKVADTFSSRLQHKQLQRKKQKQSVPLPKEVTVDIRPDNFEEEEEEDEREIQEENRAEEITSQKVFQTDSQPLEKKQQPSIPDTEKTIESSHLTQQRSHSYSSLDSERPDSKGSLLTRPSLPVPSKPQPQRKSHKFSAAQALDTLDRSSSKKQSSQKILQYEEQDPNYASWLPPTEQSGDGRTSLNDKLGY